MEKLHGFCKWCVLLTSPCKNNYKALVRREGGGINCMIPSRLSVYYYYFFYIISVIIVLRDKCVLLLY